MQLTTASMIDTLYILSTGTYGSRGKHMTALLRSYHVHRSADGDEYVTSDSVASRMVSQSCTRLPRPMHIYYVRTHPDHLRADITRYVAMTVVTAKQHHAHYTRICEMIDNAANIDPIDRQYIYTGNETDTGTQLADILYRAMWVLLHEP